MSQGMCPPGIVETCPPHAAIIVYESARPDNIQFQAKASGQANHGPGILGNIGLIKRDAHRGFSGYNVKWPSAKADDFSKGLICFIPRGWAVSPSGNGGRAYRISGVPRADGAGCVFFSAFARFPSVLWRGV